MSGFEDGSMRWCSRGRHMVSAEGFRLNAAMPGGLHSWCRACVSSYGREWREANRGYVEAYQAARRDEYRAEHGSLERVCANPECGRMFARSRRDAKTCSQKCRDRLAYLRRKGDVA